MSKPYTEGSDARGHAANVPYINFLGGNYGNGKTDKRRFWILAMIRRAANKNKPIDQAYSASQDVSRTRQSKIDVTTGNSISAREINHYVGNVYFSTMPVEFKPEFPMRDLFIHAFCDLCISLNKKTLTTTHGALEFITNTVPGLRTTNRGEYNFAVALVQLFMTNIVDDKNKPILTKPDEWGNATNGQYRDDTDILNRLFPQQPNEFKFKSKDNTAKPLVSDFQKQISDLYSDLYNAIKHEIRVVLQNSIKVQNSIKERSSSINELTNIRERIKVAFSTFLSQNRKILNAAQGNYIKDAGNRISFYLDVIIKILNDSKERSIIGEEESTLNHYLEKIQSEITKLTSDSDFDDRRHTEAQIVKHDDELLDIVNRITNCITSSHGTSDILYFPEKDVGRFFQKQTEYLAQQVRDHIKSLVNPQKQQAPQLASDPTTHLKLQLGIKQTDRNEYSRDPSDLDIVLITRPGQPPVNAADPFDRNSYCKSGLMKNYTDSSACDEFFESCITGTDIDGCKRFLQISDFFETNMAEFLKGVNLYKTMLAFFKFKIPLDATDKSHIKFKKTEEWIKELYQLASSKPHVITDNDVTAIEKNTPLLSIIDQVIELINNTPILLNRDWKESTPTKGVEPGANELTGLTPKYTSINGGTVPKQTNIRAGLTSLRTSTDKTQEAAGKALELLVANLLRVPRHVGFVLSPYVREKYTHSGGADQLKSLTNLEAREKLASIDINNISSGSSIIQLSNLISEISMNQPEQLTMLLEDLKNQLNALGSRLDNTDSSALSESNKNLEDNRNTILYVLLYGYQKLLFFDSELKDIILSTGLEFSDTGEDNRMLELYKLVDTDIKKIKEMVDLAKKKLGRYCSKVEKHVKICDQLATEVFKKDVSV